MGRGKGRNSYVLERYVKVVNTFKNEGKITEEMSIYFIILILAYSLTAITTKHSFLTIFYITFLHTSVLYANQPGSWLKIEFSCLIMSYLFITYIHCVFHSLQRWALNWGVKVFSSFFHSHHLYIISSGSEVSLNFTTFQCQ